MRFIMLDRILSFVPGESASATKNIALSEDFFEDHFPLKPIMPGVLILEGMAQLSGLVLEEGIRKASGKSQKALMSMVEKAKFRLPVYPGDRLEYECSVLSSNELAGKVKARAKRDGQTVAECEIIFSFHEYENEKLEAQRNDILKLWLSQKTEA